MTDKPLIYLDNSSTTRQADEVTDLIAEVGRVDFGNPSSLHDLGIRAEKRVTTARKIFADTIGVRPEEVFFNSCGTEGDNTVLYGAAHSRRHRGKKIITTRVEHPAVLEACKNLEKEGFRVTYLDVDEKCRLDMGQLAREIDDDTILISVMSVNNEVGTMMPVREIAEIAHSYGEPAGAWADATAKPRDSFWTEKDNTHNPCQSGINVGAGSRYNMEMKPAQRGGRKDDHRILVHTDAVQAYGKADLRNLDVDFLTVSSHKVHGPMGVGAMYRRKNVNLPAFVVGGGQEKGMRSGTENVPGIAGFGEACRLTQKDFLDNIGRMSEVRNYLMEGIRDQIPDIRINSPEELAREPGVLEAGRGICSVLNVSFLGTRGEVILHTLEEDGIFVSTGSACSSNRKQTGSHVLRAMGLGPEAIEGAIRFSFCRYNTIQEMDYVLDHLKQAVARFRRLGQFRR
ncbi:cysteine desulfurase family protein [Eubacterium pyruvativorans]|uniref:cysteine desulfurase family protein n=1 Tax=Eubacterium pyruvativorans TaxID=155865 RepID=UPI0023F482DD|nr:cysteine desulfurase family protein [Eubacterium pyruvativorans]MDD7684855.1 cysteine desulfurase family protein [Eubacterium pyruvativorans]